VAALLTPVLDFWFDFASTYSYPAAMLVEARAAEHGVSVVWHPFLLGPVFAAQGWDDSPFNIYPAKGRYMWRDMERICRAERLPFQRPETFPQRSVDAAKIALFGLDQAWGPAFIRSVFTEQFAYGQDISGHKVLQRALTQAGAPTEIAIDTALSQRSRLREETEAAQALGIFGAPTFTVGTEVFWGFDRLEAALTWAKDTTD